MIDVDGSAAPVHETPFRKIYDGLPQFCFDPLPVRRHQRPEVRRHRDIKRQSTEQRSGTASYFPLPPSVAVRVF
jgi:hypothetical protein